MKASIVSLCVLFSLIVVITLNGFYINRTTKDLTSEIEAIEINDQEKLEKSYQHWSKHHFYICLSSPHEKTDKIEECFLVMLEKSNKNEAEGFYEYKVLLLNYINDVKRLQMLTLDAIV